MKLVIKQRGCKEEELKKYEPKDAGYVVYSLPNTCFFCKHLTDIYWDYTNGPYAFFCEKEIEGDEGNTDKGIIGKCELFCEED